MVLTELLDQTATSRNVRRLKGMDKHLYTDLYEHKLILNSAISWLTLCYGNHAIVLELSEGSLELDSACKALELFSFLVKGGIFSSFLRFIVKFVLSVSSTFTSKDGGFMAIDVFRLKNI